MSQLLNIIMSQNYNIQDKFLNEGNNGIYYIFMGVI